MTQAGEQQHVHRELLNLPLTKVRRPVPRDAWEMTLKQVVVLAIVIAGIWVLLGIVL